MDYSSLIDRNHHIIPENLQKKIKETKLLFIGCGLGSQTAVLAARAGFENFTLCDGDAVEESNLNRQEFFIGDVGVNKAEAVKKHLLDINPNCIITTIDRFIESADEASELISQNDIIFNMSDPKEIFYDINDIAQEQDKLVLCPLDLGYDSFVLAFDKNSPKAEEIVGGRIIGNQAFLNIVIKTKGGVPEEISGLIKELAKFDENRTSIPQLGTTVYITSALMINACIMKLQEKNIPLAPNFICLRGVQ